MNALWIALPLVVGLQSAAKIDINVNAMSGDAISGEKTFVVRVTSPQPVSQVEFYVGQDLRETDTSTPYEFRLDTLAENDGPLRVAFKAYDVGGQSAERILNLRVNNEVDRGAAYHVERGETLLGDSRFDDALIAGRIALKADANYNPARLVLARAHLGRNTLDIAQKFAEDATIAEPRNTSALNLLAGIRLRQAFRAVVRGSGNSRDEMIQLIAKGLNDGVAARRRALEIALEQAGEPTGDNLVRWVDAAIAARRYSAAAIPLRAALATAPGQTALANRLAYCQLREWDAQGARRTLEELDRAGEFDFYSWVLMSVTRAELGDITGTDEAMLKATAMAPNEPAVLAAQAFLAMKFVRNQTAGRTQLDFFFDTGEATVARNTARQAFSRLAQRMAQEQGQHYQTAHYLSLLYNRLDEFGRGRQHFERSVLAEPINYDAYMEQANRAMELVIRASATGAERRFALASARSFYEAALKARDDAAEALTGLSLVTRLQGNAQESRTWAVAAEGASRTFAPAKVALAVANDGLALALRRQADEARSRATNPQVSQPEAAGLEAQARSYETQSRLLEVEARDALNAAHRLDARIRGQEFRDPNVAWRYFSVAGRPILMQAPRQ